MYLDLWRRGMRTRPEDGAGQGVGALRGNISRVSLVLHLHLRVVQGFKE